MFALRVQIQNPVAAARAGGDAVPGGQIDGPVAGRGPGDTWLVRPGEERELGALLEQAGDQVTSRNLLALQSIEPKDMMFSASRIGLWISCNRRAGWKYICGYPEPQHPAAALGTRVHKILEDNKRHGLLPDRTTIEGAIAAEALPYIADYVYEGPDGPVQLEGHIFVDGRHKWQGYKDLSAPAKIKDYKTSSDPRKWGKTPGELLADPQAILYAEHYYSSAPPDAPEVELEWIYLKSKPPHYAHPVSLTMPRAHAKAGFEVLESFADEMQAAEDAAPEGVAEKHKYVLTLAHDPSRCREYPPAGCPYKAHCIDIQPFSDPNTAERNNHMSVLDRLAALTAPAAPPATAEEEAAIAAVNPPKRYRKQPRKEADTIPVPAMVAEPVTAPLAPTAHDLLKAVAGTATLAVNLAAMAEKPVAPLPPMPAVADGEFPPIVPTIIDTLLVGCQLWSTTRLVEVVRFEFFVAKAQEMMGEGAYWAGYGERTNGIMLQNIQRRITEARLEALIIGDARTPEAVLALSWLRANSAVIVEGGARGH